jgi:putative nucleotidyltransferase with HDIG domain
MLAAEAIAGGQDPLRAAVAHRLATGQLSLPMLPRVASQVVALVGSPTTDASRLSELIHRDPALAGQVLRIANSPAYMPRMPIVSLQQAVSRLGLNVVSEISFAASLQSGVFRVPGYESVLNQLWRHALASGAFAKEIARVRRLNVESAFLCGLLHSVGKPALLQLVNDVAKGNSTSNSIRVGPIALIAVLDDLHTVVGVRIAEQWGLPKPVAASIEHHAAYAQAGAFRQEAMITFLADRLATHAIEPTRFGGDDGFRDTPVIADLNLYPDDVAGLLARRERVLELVAAMVA